MMWATQAPMEQLKQMVVKAGWEGARGGRGVAGQGESSPRRLL
jgi:hypothetical protein